MAGASPGGSLSFPPPLRPFRCALSSAEPRSRARRRAKSCAAFIGLLCVCRRAPIIRSWAPPIFSSSSASQSSMSPSTVKTALSSANATSLASRKFCGTLNQSGSRGRPRAQPVERREAALLLVRVLREPRDVGAAVDHPLLHLVDGGPARRARRVVHRDLAVEGRRHEGGVDAAAHAERVRRGRSSPSDLVDDAAPLLPRGQRHPCRASSARSERCRRACPIAELTRVEARAADAAVHLVIFMRRSLTMPLISLDRAQ